VKGHGVAVAALQVGEAIAVIMLQCECGWHERCGEVTTADAIAEAVAEHRGRLR